MAVKWLTKSYLFTSTLYLLYCSNPILSSCIAWRIGICVHLMQHKSVNSQELHTVQTLILRQTNKSKCIIQNKIVCQCAKEKTGINRRRFKTEPINQQLKQKLMKMLSGVLPDLQNPCWLYLLTHKALLEHVIHTIQYSSKRYSILSTAVSKLTILYNIIIVVIYINQDMIISIYQISVCYMYT